MPLPPEPSQNNVRANSALRRIVSRTKTKPRIPAPTDPGNSNALLRLIAKKGSPTS